MKRRLQDLLDALSLIGFTPVSVQNAVLAATFNQYGELTTIPAGSEIGMKFYNNEYRFECTISGVPTDYVKVWIRLIKG